MRVTASGITAAAAAGDLAIPRGRSLNAVLLPAGLWVRLSIFSRRKIIRPSHLLLYVRYSAAGWRGDMDLPPHGLSGALR